MPLQAGTVEWKLYLRLLGEIDREFDLPERNASLPAGVPFLRIERDGEGAVVLRADPAAEP